MWIEVRDELNRIVMDGDTRVSRCLGVIDCNPAGGSFTDPNLAQGTGWAVAIPIEAYSGWDVLATAKVQGTTVTYTYSKKRCRLLWGTY
ncbi:MAG: hypothetical protein GAK28_03234 [Luteibacter sp.]|nr:MAG: hypothetical protein GAK28_03234 [Luteibacter sp.]